MTRTVLLAVDGSPGAERALQLLEGYRGEPSQIEVVAVNVQTPPVTLWPGASIDTGVLHAALLASGQKIADSATERLRSAGLRVRPLVKLGSPVEILIQEAEARAAEVIFMGTRGHGALHGFALGSVAMRVAHASSVPVCLMRPESVLPRQFGRSLKVALAVDGSEPALRAARMLAASRAWLGDLDVEIVFVQQALSYLEIVLPPHDDMIEQWSTRAADSASKAVRNLFAGEGIRNHLRGAAGDEAAEIMRLASETNCDLLALGTRGLGAMHHALIGSVALKVAAQADMPVIVVK